MTKLALIADDLTGALDSAAPFAQAGLRVRVATGPDHLGACLAAGPEVLAVSLNTREGGAPEAATRARAAAETLAGVPRIFKKIDSRMKGHVLAETRAIWGLRGGQVVICPAIPELGRIVAGGHLQGRGVADPIPVLTPPGWSAPDARTEADLDRILAAAGPALLVGARGLAAALARQMGGPGPAPLPPLPRPIVFLVGSRDPITLAQVAALSLPPDACPDGEVPPLSPGLSRLLLATEGPGAPGPVVAARLAQGALPHLTAARSLVLTGGETAAAALDALGVTQLELIGEVATGLPLSRAPELPGAPLIVTKSGGFGAAEALESLFRASADRPMQAPTPMPERPDA